MPSLVILLCVSGVYWDNGYCLKYFSILLLCNIVFHLATWSIDKKTIRWWCDSYTNTHTPNLKSMTMPYLGRVPSPGWKRACNFISHPEMWKDGLGGGGDPVSAISHEAAGLCPDPYTSTGLAQLIKVTPSPPTSTPYLRVGPLSRCVQFGAAADYLFIYLPIIWFLFSD